MLGAWIVENKTEDWSTDCLTTDIKFIQVKQRCALYYGKYLLNIS